MRIRGARFRQNPAIASSDELVCCDLRGCVIDGLDLSRTSFIGCRLNGTSFRHVSLRDAQFLGCISIDADAPTELHQCDVEGLAAKDNHLHLTGDTAASFTSQRWPDDPANLAAPTLDGTPADINRACEKLGKLGFRPAAAMLGALFTHEEWDVRASALGAMASLRGQGFPWADDLLVEWMLFLAGDEHSIVRENAAELVSRFQVRDELLGASVARIAAASPGDRAAGLRAAAALFRHDHTMLRLFDTACITSLAVDADEGVRSEALHTLGVLDIAGAATCIAHGLEDSRKSVRLGALQALRLLEEEERPSARLLLPLLQDSDAEVRLETLHSLPQTPDFNPDDVKPLLVDPDDSVRAAAQELVSSADAE